MAKIFTKKVALIALTAVVALSGVIWAIVANLQSKFKFSITTTPPAIYVSGNGTASVMVDDYLYFVGDSVETSSINYGDNEYYADGKMHDAGIYRVKIEGTKPVLEYEYDNTSVNEQGEKIKLTPEDEGYNTNVVGIKDWERIGKKNNGIQAVVPKIAGHDQSAMWVFGNNLIYTSPHNRYDNRGKLLSNYLDFFRVDLDGKNHTLIYTSESADLTTENFTVWADATDNIYLLVYETEDQAVKKINIQNKKVATIAKDVTAVVFPSATQYCQNNINENLDKVYGGVMSYVYYTKDREEKDSNLANLLYRCAIQDGEPELIASEGSAEQGTTFKPLAVTPLENGNAQFVFSLVVKNATTTVRGPYLCLINNNNMQEYVYKEPSPEEDTWGLNEEKEVKIYGNRFCTVDKYLYRYDVNGTVMNFNPAKLLTAEVEKVLAVFENTIYVQNGTTVWQVRPDFGSSSVSVVPVTEDETEDTADGEATGGEDATEEETATATLTLPVAILYQPHGNTGDPMIFAQDENQIRLYTSDGKLNYVRFK